jgi:iron complex transport system substrate-binding protein
MKKFFLNLIFIASVPVLAQSYSVTDDLGNSIFFENPPEAVISLAPNITEMIYQLNVDSTLVGNTQYCYFPEEAKHVTKVGDMLTFNYEEIIKLNPDLIFMTVEGNQKTAYEKLLDLGFQVFVSNPRNYEGIKKTFNDLGNIFGKQQLSKRKIADWDSTYNYILTESQKLQPQTVMILVELNPIMIAGKNTFINGYIETCNMKNFVEGVIMNYPVFSRESVIERNPDIIVYPSSGKEKVSTLIDTYPEWKDLTAVINNKVFFVDRDLYFRPGPRFIEALTDFYSRLLKTAVFK